MYAAVADPYCYPGTTVLINRLGVRDRAKLEAFETEVTAERAGQPLPVGRLSYRDREMKRLFAGLKKRNFLRGLDAVTFAKEAAHFLAELNAVPPFREGNGRTQLSFLTILAERAKHPLNMDRLSPPAIMKATVRSFAGDEKHLARLILRLNQE